jgi:hypothetical protein
MTEKDAWRNACDMERPLEAIRCFALALDRVAQTLNDGNAAAILQEIGLTIQARVEELDDIHGYFFQLHHPSRERFEREGWPAEQAGREVCTSGTNSLRSVEAT